MAIYVTTEHPNLLKSLIKEKIENEEIVTWVYDSDGDFTHAAAQWARHAWLRPYIEEDRIVFGVVCPRKNSVSKVDYSIYMGRFIEMLICHCSPYIASVRVSAKPSLKYDIMSPVHDED